MDQISEQAREICGAQRSADVERSRFLVEAPRRASRDEL